MTDKMPTDPLADASTGVVRRSRGAFVKSTPERKPDRRRPSRQGQYKGPERRTAESAPAGTPSSAPASLFGFPRWIVITAGAWLAALVLAMILIFTY